MNCPYLHPVPECDRLWCVYYWRAANCAHCPGPVGGIAYFSNYRLHIGPRPINPAEYVCLHCTLPECDENAAGCLYAQAKEANAEPKPAPRCPHPACGKLITSTARTCTHHRWYK